MHVYESLKLLIEVNAAQLELYLTAAPNDMNTNTAAQVALNCPQPVAPLMQEGMAVNRQVALQKAWPTCSSHKLLKVCIEHLRLLPSQRRSNTPITLKSTEKSSTRAGVPGESRGV